MSIEIKWQKNCQRYLNDNNILYARTVDGSEPVQKLLSIYHSHNHNLQHYHAIFIHVIISCGI